MIFVFHTYLWGCTECSENDWHILKWNSSNSLWDKIKESTDKRKQGNFYKYIFKKSKYHH